MTKQHVEISDKEKELLDILAEIIAIDIIKEIKNNQEDKDERK
jgi:hypothetical protein